MRPNVFICFFQDYRRWYARDYKFYISGRTFHPGSHYLKLHTGPYSE
jgi:hypothetical protein